MKKTYCSITLEGNWVYLSSGVTSFIGYIEWVSVGCYFCQRAELLLIVNRHASHSPVL